MTTITPLPTAVRATHSTGTRASGAESMNAVYLTTLKHFNNVHASLSSLWMIEASAHATFAAAELRDVADRFTMVYLIQDLVPLAFAIARRKLDGLNQGDDINKGSSTTEISTGQ